MTIKSQATKILNISKEHIIESFSALKNTTKKKDNPQNEKNPNDLE